MQQTHTHKAVTWRVEAKKLLSRRRQSEYSETQIYTEFSINFTWIEYIDNILTFPFNR